MEKYKNKYRIPSARAPFWDYSWNAAYFITISTKYRKPWFGEISEGKMHLSPIGHIANSCWHRIPNHFPFVELGAHIIMPDHVHGIVIINAPPGNANRKNMTIQPPPSQKSGIVKPGEEPVLNKTKNKFGPQSKNLASIIRGFKVGVTVNARKVNTNFGWLPRYHDRIIRDEKAFQTISTYILNNPKNWKKKNGGF